MNRPMYFEIWPSAIEMTCFHGSTAGYTTDVTGTVWGPAMWTDDTQPRTARPAKLVMHPLWYHQRWSPTMEGRTHYGPIVVR